MDVRACAGDVGMNTRWRRRSERGEKRGARLEVRRDDGKDVENNTEEKSQGHLFLDLAFKRLNKKNTFWIVKRNDLVSMVARQRQAEM